jgi:hypothetical protein
MYSLSIPVRASTSKPVVSVELYIIVLMLYGAIIALKKVVAADLYIIRD